MRHTCISYNKKDTSIARVLDQISTNIIYTVHTNMTYKPTIVAAWKLAMPTVDFDLANTIKTNKPHLTIAISQEYILLYTLFTTIISNSILTGPKTKPQINSAVHTNLITALNCLMPYLLMQQNKHPVIVIYPV